MLHIQVPVCFTDHLHVPCLLLAVLAEYDLQLCAYGKKRLLCCLCSCTLCEGMHAQVTSQGGGRAGRGGGGGEGKERGGRGRRGKEEGETARPGQRQAPKTGVILRWGCREED